MYLCRCLWVGLCVNAHEDFCMHLCFHVCASIYVLILLQVWLVCSYDYNVWRPTQNQKTDGGAVRHNTSTLTLRRVRATSGVRIMVSVQVVSIRWEVHPEPLYPCISECALACHPRRIHRQFASSCWEKLETGEFSCIRRRGKNTFTLLVSHGILHLTTKGSCSRARNSICKHVLKPPGKQGSAANT